MKSRATILLLLAGLAGCGADDTRTSAAVGEAHSADGVPIAFEVRGSGDPTIVLVHGWTNSRAIWGEHPHTLARTHRTVALDLAGHGVSGDDRQDWTMDAFGDDVAAVVDELELQRVVLVGFSMGGAVVLEAAERLEDRVVGVVFVDMFKDPDRQLDDAAAERMLAGIRANWGDTAFLRAGFFRPDVPDSLVQYVAEMTPGELREHWIPTFHSMRAWMATEFEPTLRRVAAGTPVAAINATDPPTNVEALRGHAPGFTVDTIAGVGHAGILLRRVEDFDARLLALVERFDTGQVVR